MREVRSDIALCARSACAFFALAVVALSARADFVGAVQIDFQSGTQSGSYQVVLPANTDPYSWALSSPIDIYSATNPGVLIGTIGGLDLTLIGDPSVALAFSVTAAGAPTHVTITSSMVTFAPLVNPLAFATAAMTVTDLDGDGATATGLFPGSLAYQAFYNGSSVFANLVSPINAAADSSAVGVDRFPIAGMTTIFDAVTSIQSQFDFMLTAFDSASGTSRFDVVPVPEPASMILAVLGGFAVVACRARLRR